MSRPADSKGLRKTPRREARFRTVFGRGISYQSELSKQPGKVITKVSEERALDAAQAEAARSGASAITMDEIDAEIAAYRRERRAQTSAR